MTPANAPAREEPSLLSTRAGLTRTRSRKARHCRESVRETGGERGRVGVRLHRTFQQRAVPEETVISVTGRSSRARLDAHFRRFARPLTGRPQHLKARGQIALVPVVVADVGSTGGFDHFGGNGCGPTLGMPRAIRAGRLRIVQAVRADDEGATRPLFLLR